MSVKTQLAALPREEKRAFAIVGLAAVAWWGAYNSLHTVADTLTYTILGLDDESHLGATCNYPGKAASIVTIDSYCRDI